ncbi:YadA-like family protein [Paraburkholderia hayleyella]|uniref:YadA-like family protein n=1 Tax=Paraburkholderia hayleyella TaxID=2152889 RepID=UPI001580AFF7|nr:YadA-like family protein [Paraburkholderia hayleyella]
MNRIYRTIWSAATQTWAVASELAKAGSEGSPGKDKNKDADRHSRKKRVALATSIALASGMAGVASNDAWASDVSDDSSGGYTETRNESDVPGYHPTEAGNTVQHAAQRTAQRTAQHAAQNPAPSTVTGNLKSAVTNSPAVANSTKALADAATAGFSRPAASAPVAHMLAASPPPLSDFMMLSTNVDGGATNITTGVTNSMTIGPRSTVKGSYSMAVGIGAAVNMDNGTALGRDATVVDKDGTAIGMMATTGLGSVGAVAIGKLANAVGANSLAIGTGSTANGVNSLALGTKALTSAANAIALGTNSLADRESVVSVGNATVQRQIINMAAGTQAHDAVNVDQFKGVVSALGGGAALDASGSVKAPAYTVAGSTYNNIGAALNAAAGASQPDAVVYDSSAHDKLTLGGGATGAVITNLGAGKLAADSSDAVNGAQLFSTNQDVGRLNSTVDKLRRGKDGLIQQDSVSRNFFVAGALDGEAVDFSGIAGVRELTGVMAGKADTSAANVGQLKGVAASLGGGAGFDANGAFHSPTYTVQGGQQTSVDGALGALDNSVSSLATQINGAGLGIVAQNPVSRDITVGATADGTRINFAGTAGSRVLAGVRAGGVSAASDEAINGAQLYANASSMAAMMGGGAAVNPDGTFSKPVFTLGGTTLNNVGDALSQLDGRVSKNSSDITTLQTTVNTGGGRALNAVQYDSAAHDKVTFGNAGGSKVKLTHLDDGELSANSTDAVTGGQLFRTNQRVDTLTGVVQNTMTTGSASIAEGPVDAAIGKRPAVATEAGSVALGNGSVADQANTVSVGAAGNERRIVHVGDAQQPTDAVNLRQYQQGLAGVARHAYAGVAAATALTMIPDVDLGRTIAVGVSTANYRGYQAGALGISARVNPNIKVKVGAGLSASGSSVGGGASYQW